MSSQPSPSLPLYSFYRRQAAELFPHPNILNTIKNQRNKAKTANIHYNATQYSTIE